MPPLVIVEAPPRLDAASSPAFEVFVSGLVRAGAERLVIDLSTAGYLGSAGVRALLLIARTLGGQNGRLALMGARPAVVEVLRICGLAEQFIQVEIIEAARQRI